MDKEQLSRSLKSIGMQCFVKYFEAFNDPIRTDKDLIEGFMRIEGFEESGARTRVIQSRRILREGKEEEALRKVLDSSKVDVWVIEKSKHLLSTTRSKGNHNKSS